MNKKIITGAIIGGIALFGYSIYYYIKKQTELLKNFQWKILDFGIKQFDAQVIKGTLSVYFSSESDVEITIKQFLVNFYFNGVYVGYVEEQSKFVIPAKGSAIIPLEYTLNPQLIIGNITDIIAYATKEKDGNISIRGNASVKSGFISSSFPIEYDTKISELLA